MNGAGVRATSQDQRQGRPSRRAPFVPQRSRHPPLRLLRRCSCDIRSQTDIASARTCVSTEETLGGQFWDQGHLNAGRRRRLFPSCTPRVNSNRQERFNHRHRDARRRSGGATQGKAGSDRHPRAPGPTCTFHRPPTPTHPRSCGRAVQARTCGCICAGQRLDQARAERYARTHVRTRWQSDARGIQHPRASGRAPRARRAARTHGRDEPVLERWRTRWCPAPDGPRGGSSGDTALSGPGGRAARRVPSARATATSSLRAHASPAPGSARHDGRSGRPRRSPHSPQWPTASARDGSRSPISTRSRV